jgi:microcin C transport system permease protein
MNFAQSIMDPLTLKRFNRFRRHRRAYLALWILALLYGLGLIAEVICNDRPLYVRYKGKSYFPFARFYPESTFLEGGAATRPDYKALQRSETFRHSPSTFMIFPPVPFGPEEIVDPDTLRPEERVMLTLTAIPRVASVDVSQQFEIERARNADWFFQTRDSSLQGIGVARHWDVPPAIQDAVKARFRNESADAVEAVVPSLDNPSRTAIFALAPYRPRSRNPQTVRLTLREPAGTLPPSLTLAFKRDFTILGGTPPGWHALPETARAELHSRVAAAFEAPGGDTYATVGDHQYRIRSEKNDVQWPHPPTGRHWLGIDKAGRDVFARIIYGLRISMTFAFVLVAASTAIGVVIGSVQGYCGGHVDLVGQRLIEIWATLPFLYIMILMGSVYGRSFLLLLFCYGIFRWIGISYYMRAEFLRLRKQPFVEAARALGIPNHRIMFRHILPNALTPVITFLPFSLVGAIASLTALDYLGFGLPPPTPSWGELLHQAQQFRWAWWLILYPSLAVFIVMLLGVFVGEGVRDAFDPRPLSRME